MGLNSHLVVRLADSAIMFQRAAKILNSVKEYILKVISEIGHKFLPDTLKITHIIT